MNYLQLFAKGGKTQNVIKSIQNILGVDDNQMAELWQVGLNKYGSEEGLAQAINEATKGLTPQSSPDEVKAALASVFTTESEMFKCGGKMRKLAKRMAKGSKLKCGCGCDGIKVKKNQYGGLINPPRFNNLPDKYYTENGKYVGTPQRYILPRGYNGDIVVMSPTPQAKLNNTTNQSAMLWNPGMLQEPYYKSIVLTKNPEGKGYVGHVPMQQDGGEVSNTQFRFKLPLRKYVEKLQFPQFNPEDVRKLRFVEKVYRNTVLPRPINKFIDNLNKNTESNNKSVMIAVPGTGLYPGTQKMTIDDKSLQL